MNKRKNDIQNDDKTLEMKITFKNNDKKCKLTIKKFKLTVEKSDD